MITEPEAQPNAPKQHRSAWLWVAALMTVVALALLVWGLSMRSDLNSTQSDLDHANAQVKTLQDKAAQNTTVAQTVSTAFKGAYQQLTTALGATTEDLATANSQLATANDNAAKAQQAAATAADKAKTAKDKVQAAADQARADAQAAGAKATVVADCAKSALSALGQLFAGDSVRAQLATVRESLQTIAANCKTALS